MQLKLSEDEESTYIEGTHDIDYKWMLTLREVNPKIKIVPRVVFENWSHAALAVLLTNSKLPAFVGKQLADLAKVW